MTQIYAPSRSGYFTTMRFIITIISFSFVLSSVTSSPARALSHMKYCQGIESTAEAMACVKDHKDAAQARLIKAYEALRLHLEKKSAALEKEVRAMAEDKIDLVSQTAPAESGEEQTEAAKSEQVDDVYKISLDTLETIQKDWIAFRDEQCKWDSELAESPSLRRVYELSCITDLTEKRSDYLYNILGNEMDDNPREFGGTPRWMNVLTMEHPDVFWRHGQIVRADVNCDDRDEYIMGGVAFKTFHIPADTGVTAEGDAETATAADDMFDKSREIVIAVADNPVTGKPKTQILKIPVYTHPENTGTVSDGTHIGLCREQVTMALAALPEDSQLDDSEQTEHADNEDTSPSCAKILQISDHVCQPLMLRWSGAAYDLAPLVIQSE